MANAKMRTLYRRVMCSESSQLSNCSRIDSPAIGFSYAGFIVLLHNGSEWERVADATRRLSECGIAYALVDTGRRDFESARVMACPHGAAAIVFDTAYGNAYFNVRGPDLARARGYRNDFRALLDSMIQPARRLSFRPAILCPYFIAYVQTRCGLRVIRGRSATPWDTRPPSAWCM